MKMDYKVSGVTFVFENCDSVSFLAHQIGDCQIGGIHEVIQRVALNAITDSDVADEVFIEIAAGANVQYVPFGIKAAVNVVSMTVFDRICQGDITQIVLSYENGFELSLQIPFEDCPVHDNDSGHKNRYQDTYVSEKGIHICISSTGKKALDYIKKNHENGSVFLDYISDHANTVLNEKHLIMTDRQVDAYIDSIKDSDVYQNLKIMRNSGEDEHEMYQKFFAGIMDLLRVHGYDPDWLSDVFEPKIMAIYDL